MPRRLRVTRVTVDFSEVEEFEPLPKGEYPAVIESIEYREAQEEGKFDYLNVEYTVTEPEFKGRKLWQVWSFSPKSLWRMKQTLENLGVFEEEIEVDYDEESMIVTEPALVGTPVMLTVSTRPYEGRIQNDVTAVTSPDGASAGKAEPGKKAAPAKKTTPAAKKTTGRKFQ
jgi:hypothetical protein